MAKRVVSMNMLEGSIADKLFYFAWPLAITVFLQQLFNTADVITVGQLISSNAMGAVGSNTPIIGTLVSLLVGVSLGTNVVLARHLGAKEHDLLQDAIGTSMLTGLVAGIGLAVLGIAFSGELLHLLQVPQEIFQESEEYLRLFLLGIPAISLYNFESAILRSKGDSKTPMIALAIGSILNIFLNLAAICLFNGGIGAVGLTTALSYYVSVAYLLVSLHKQKGRIYFRLNHICFSSSQPTPG